MRKSSAQSGLQAKKDDKARVQRLVDDAKSLLTSLNADISKINDDKVCFLSVASHFQLLVLAGSVFRNTFFIHVSDNFIYLFTKRFSVVEITTSDSIQFLQRCFSRCYFLCVNPIMLSIHSTTYFGCNRC